MFLNKFILACLKNRLLGFGWKTLVSAGVSWAPPVVSNKQLGPCL